MYGLASINEYVSEKSANRANTKRDLINTCTCFVVHHIICKPHGVVQIYVHGIPGVLSKRIQGNLVALYAIMQIGIYTFVVKSKLILNVSSNVLH